MKKYSTYLWEIRWLKTLKPLSHQGKLWKKCPVCRKEFYEKNGTLPNLKGFCSLKCYEVFRKFYVCEEKQKIKATVKAIIREKFAKEKMPKMQKYSEEWIKAGDLK